MRVLFVATLLRDHIEKFHIPYLKMFKEHGWYVEVAAGNDTGKEAAIPYCDAYHDIRFGRLPWQKANISAYKKLKKLIEENDYKIIHCHVHISAALTRMAARKAGNRGVRRSSTPLTDSIFSKNHRFETGFFIRLKNSLAL